MLRYLDTQVSRQRQAFFRMKRVGFSVNCPDIMSGAFIFSRLYKIDSVFYSANDSTRIDEPKAALLELPSSSSPSSPTGR